MHFDNQIIILLRNLVSQGGLILFFAFLLTRIKVLKRMVLATHPQPRDIVILVLFFSGIGILGTYTGIPIMGALANARVVGVFVGGLLGGPLVGISSGVLAGLHRWSIDIGGFTSVACMVSTVTEGVIAGLFSFRFRKAEKKWLFAARWGATAELIQMVLILLIARPFADAFQLVQIIALPMVLGNAVGIGMFIAVSEDAFHEEERIAAKQSHRVLSTARETTEFLHTGFTPETAAMAASIILKNLKVSAVSLTDREKCLAHKGAGENHHKVLEPLRTSLTREVIQSGSYRVAHTKEEISCSEYGCPLSSAVIVPLKIKGQTIGTLKLYRTGRRTVNSVDIEVALGLATLFSTQIEVSELQRQSELLATAELQALHSQIRPHFLFNALTTITSLIRTKPQQARALLISLSELLRRSLKKPDTRISLEEELKYIRSYLEIEKTRFGDKISIEYAIDAPKSTPLPPLTLQPIVENAVKHGISGKLQGGTIWLSARQKGGSICFEVRDNGIGMDRGKVSCALNRDKHSDNIGLRNVNERLEYLYGRGLHITSVPGEGTTVEFTIPVQSSLMIGA
jgi:two-component system, LytTR family, sensor histidine kinase LytS